MNGPISRLAAAMALAAGLAFSAGANGTDADAPKTAVEMPEGKRVAPPEVEPVLIDGLRIEAVHWGRSRGFGQNGGYIAAIDPASGEEVWTLNVYTVAYNPALEEDVQDVFIETMQAVDGNLVIADEEGRRYRVDVATKTVSPL